MGNKEIITVGLMIPFVAGGVATVQSILISIIMHACMQRGVCETVRMLLQHTLNLQLIVRERSPP